MKANYLVTASLVLTLLSCQNNSQKTAEDHEGHDSSAMTHPTEGRSQMMMAMDKMMKDMHQLKMTGNIDVDFARMMKSHHEGAVEMAREELASGQDQQLKQMAQQIVDSQKSEIEALDDFLDKHESPEKNYDPAQKDTGFGKIMNKSMVMMMDMPKMEASSSTDKQFAVMMIPHHQSAVYMAEGLIQNGKDPNLISMAKKMISDQTREIEELKKWNESH